MDEAWVIPKSLLNYREIPVVRALDRREVIGCCLAAVNLHLERIFSIKRRQVASCLCWMFFSVSY